MRNPIKQITLFFLTLLFIYAAISKLIDFNEFRGQLYNQTFPHWLADVLWFALPITELVTASLLMSRRLAYAGLIASLFLLTLFTGYIGLVLMHVWSRVPCSCGGILSHMSWQGHFVFNICCMLLNLSALWRTSIKPKFSGQL